MLSYKEYEKVLFDWLIAKHDQDPNFTFTVRQSAGKGSEVDYFIGTAKSNYFATSFWTLPVSFPGSSGDCINLILQLSKIGYSYYFEFNQTQTPEDAQNKSALNLIRALKTPLEKVFEFRRPVQEANKMYTIQVASNEKSYDNLELMLADIDGQLGKILELTDMAIENEKKNNPDFKAHRVTSNEFNSLIDRLNKRIEKHGSSFDKLLSDLGGGVTQLYFGILKKLLNDLALEQSSDKIYFNYDNEKLIFGIGQRYIFNLDKAGFFRMISKNKTVGNVEEFKAEPKAYLTNYPLIQDLEPYYDQLLLAAQEMLAITNKSGYYKFDKKDFREMAFKAAVKITDSTTKKNKMPLNQILYGPPGTGKTYKLKNEYFDKFTVRETEVSKEQFIQQILTELNWWQVITLVLIEKKQARVREIYDHPFIQIKERISQSKTVMQTLWGQLQSHTLLDCKYVNVVKRIEPLYFWKDEDSIWSIEEDIVTEIYPEAYDLLKQINNFKPTQGKEIKNYEFITFHQSYSYEDFIEGIKPNLGIDSDQISYAIEDGIFKQLCRRASSDLLHDYGLFIDEINRGNVSAIFGELITLIEESKRKGNSEELEVTLPYSKEKFFVPKNVYIIGTMNTADRSVEALDTALRRRFSFTQMMPKADLLGNLNFEGINLAEVLVTINNRIKLLLDADHQIGHSYLIDITSPLQLASGFNNCIIPLLQEYFYHDEEKIAMILGPGFVKVDQEPETLSTQFAHFEGIDFRYPVFKKKFGLKRIDESTILPALQALLASV